MNFDILAIGAHPDDIELACGGTLAVLARSGRKVGLVHLTSGEAGSRGTPEGRRREARAAAAALGAGTVEFLACGDGALRTGTQEEDAVIEVLRRLRPELILGPSASDRHPDHGRAHQLVEAACFYSGLAKRSVEAGGGEAREPHRPAAVFHYMPHDPFEPKFVVDVSAVWDRKLAALDCYASQLHQSEAERRAHGPPTKVASPEYRLAFEGRARHFGLLIGAEFGEPFASRLPLAVRDPFSLLPAGLR